MKTPVIRNFIGGTWLDSTTGALLEHRNPADLTQTTCAFQRSGREDAVRAIDAAEAAFESWANTPAPKRAEILSIGNVNGR